MKIGFIGVGVMGGPMVLNLMKKGFDVSIYTLTKSKAEGVIAAGAHWCDTIADCAAGRRCGHHDRGLSQRRRGSLFLRKGHSEQRGQGHGSDRYDHHQPAPFRAHLMPRPRKKA